MMWGSRSGIGGGARAAGWRALAQRSGVAWLIGGADQPPSQYPVSPADEPVGANSPVAPNSFGLSARLLLLTAVFVMLAEVLIFLPSIANFRVNWLTDRLTAARQLETLSLWTSTSRSRLKTLR